MPPQINSGYKLFIFSKETFLTLYISHSIVRSVILSQSLFYDKVNTSWPPWVACSACHGQFLWPSCVRFFSTLFYFVFLSFLSVTVVMYSLFMARQNSNLLSNLVFRCNIWYNFLFVLRWFGWARLFGVCPEALVSAGRDDSYLYSTPWHWRALNW